MLDTKNLLQQFESLSYDDKYEKLLAVAGILKQKNFSFAKMYVSLDLLKEKKSLEESYLTELYGMILAVVEQKEGEEVAEKMKKLESQLSTQMNHLEKMAQAEDEAVKESNEADKLLETL